jgi:glutamine amidotransferase
MQLSLIDYGAGNLTSVVKGFHAVGAEVRVIDHVRDLGRPAGIVIPGVGHFSTTASLDRDWRGPVDEAIAAGVPLLGICVGLQWLFEGSEEAPGTPGYGLMRGRCFRLHGDVKVPHVGWNTLDFAGGTSRLLDGVRPGASAYFTHSYAAPVGADVAAATKHGAPFAAAVERDRVFGVQFHPEKSGATGLQILKNFLRVATGSL